MASYLHEEEDHVEFVHRHPSRSKAKTRTTFYLKLTILYEQNMFVLLISKPNWRHYKAVSAFTPGFKP